MRIGSIKALVAALSTLLSIAACAPTLHSKPGLTSPIELRIVIQRDQPALVTYDLSEPTNALHFAQELGGYRAQDWQFQNPGFRWVSEGTGERIERADGKSFDSLEFRIPTRYRALPKSYAPFSPFSEGSMLVHTGQFHACLVAPCTGTDPLPIQLTAAGKIIGISGRRVSGQAIFVSRDEGTNVFVGTLPSVKADGFIAVIDPGLPDDIRQHLTRSLPYAMNDFAQLYGPLSFTPELYVSIDARPRTDGHESTQGGTLPKQIFMHFDGRNARERLAKGSPFWLDWFFAHEAAHLVQQDKVGKLVGDDTVAWIHEGGADAMAALSLAQRGNNERNYVEQRVREAEAACVKGLADMPLDRATARGNFDLHYQCGLLIWLALDGEIRKSGRDGLHALNRAFFERVRFGEPWDEAVFLSTARRVGASDGLLARIAKLNAGGYKDVKSELDLLRQSAAPLVIVR